MDFFMMTWSATMWSPNLSDLTCLDPPFRVAYGFIILAILHVSQYGFFGRCVNRWWGETASCRSCSSVLLPWTPDSSSVGGFISISSTPTSSSSVTSSSSGSSSSSMPPSSPACSGSGGWRRCHSISESTASSTAISAGAEKGCSINSWMLSIERLSADTSFSGTTTGWHSSSRNGTRLLSLNSTTSLSGLIKIGLLFLPHTKSYPSSRHRCPIDSAGGESFKTYGLNPSDSAGMCVSILLSAVIGPLAVASVMFTSASRIFDCITTCWDSPTMSWSVPVSPNHLVPLTLAGVAEALAYLGVSSFEITLQCLQHKSDGPSGWWSQLKSHFGEGSSFSSIKLSDFAQRIASTKSASLGLGQSCALG